MRIRFHAEAESELVEAEAWYRKRSEVAAQAFLLEIGRALTTISDGPHRGPRELRGERRFVVDRFPYTIRYWVRLDEIFVTAVAHQSRRPGYWRKRK
jgi:plasmid stabilization system protein ParE